MPAILEAIDKMSVSEKVSTMEYLWNALTEHYAETPSWHAEVLAQRRRRLENGDAELLSVDEAEAQSA